MRFSVQLESGDVLHAQVWDTTYRDADHEMQAIFKGEITHEGKKYEAIFSLHLDQTGWHTIPRPEAAGNTKYLRYRFFRMSRFGRNLISVPLPAARDVIEQATRQLEEWLPLHKEEIIAEARVAAWDAQDALLKKATQARNRARAEEEIASALEEEANSIVRRFGERLV